MKLILAEAPTDPKAPDPLALRIIGIVYKCGPDPITSEYLRDTVAPRKAARVIRESLEFLLRCRECGVELQEEIVDKIFREFETSKKFTRATLSHILKQLRTFLSEDTTVEALDEQFSEIDFVDRFRNLLKNLDDLI